MNIKVNITVSTVAVASYGNVNDTEWLQLCAVRERARELGGRVRRAPYISQHATLFMSWSDPAECDHACTVLTMQFDNIQIERK